MKAKKIFLIITVLGLFSSAANASAYGNVKKGNRLFNKGQYDKAVEKYREAQFSEPNSEVINFNLGNSFHKAEKYEEAQNEYNKALSSKKDIIRAGSYYNLGNNAVMRGKTDEAIEYYKKALDVNPNDINAKYNIEFLRLLQANPQACKDPREGKEGKEDKNKKEKQDAKGKDGEGKEKEDQSKAGPAEAEKDKMSKEDAQRILQYYSDAEKQAAEKRKIKTPQMPEVDEDW